jgi:ribosome-associated protein YbcJ (S4-like RNA binding protein)
MSSSLPLPPNLPLYRKPYSLPHSTLFLFPIPKLSPHSLFKSHICYSTSPSNSDREEVRWLREEQRWLREEQRWLREEQRWDRERDALLHEISNLKLRIQALEHQNSIQGASVSETIANIAGLLQVLKERGLITESGSSASPMILLEKEKEKEKEELVVVEEKVVRVSEEGEKKRRKTLRKGSEGDEVQAMQVCSQSLLL